MLARVVATESADNQRRRGRGREARAQRGAGLADRQDGWQYDPDSSDAFEDGSYGYDAYYVDLGEYQYYFREGFRRGYEDGYYGRYQYGAYSNGKYSILGNILSLILDLRRY